MRRRGRAPAALAPPAAAAAAASAAAATAWLAPGGGHSSGHTSPTASSAASSWRGPWRGGGAGGAPGSPCSEQQRAMRSSSGGGSGSSSSSLVNSRAWQQHTAQTLQPGICAADENSALTASKAVQAHLRACSCFLRLKLPQHWAGARPGTQQCTDAVWPPAALLPAAQARGQQLPRLQQLLRNAAAATVGGCRCGRCRSCRALRWAAAGVCCCLQVRQHGRAGNARCKAFVRCHDRSVRACSASESSNSSSVTGSNGKPSRVRDFRAMLALEERASKTTRPCCMLCGTHRRGRPAGRSRSAPWCQPQPAAPAGSSSRALPPAAALPRLRGRAGAAGRPEQRHGSGRQAHGIAHAAVPGPRHRRRADNMHACQ